MKNDIDIIKKAKKCITTSFYGKFDYLEELFGRDFLIKQKPRIVYAEILQKLELKMEDINRNSFYSWLARYKKAPKFKKSEIPKTQFQSEPIEFWKDFQPMDPTIFKKNESVRLVQISDREMDFEKEF